MNSHLNHTLPLAMGKCIYERVPKLALYKECMAIAKAVPDKRVRDMSINEVRSVWRKNIGDGGQVLQLNIASCLDRISYGRMCLTKQRQRMLPNASERYAWDVNNPMENHKSAIKKREEKQNPDGPAFGEGKRDFVPMSNWGYGNVDPDVIRRHKEQSDREHFMGPHWRGKQKPMIFDDFSFEEQLAIQFQPKPKVTQRLRKEF